MDRIEIHWMTLIVSVTLLVLLIVGLVKEKIQKRRFKNKKSKENLD
jgi:putative effector of murein hydrolase LrgA (UPF0299 family)